MNNQAAKVCKNRPLVELKKNNLPLGEIVNSGLSYHFFCNLRQEREPRYVLSPTMGNL
jgi:hypothetical protein